jgi:allantoin racemase
MRILVVNPNTSATVTALVTKAAKRAAAPGTEFKLAGGAFGPRVGESWSENAIAAHSTVDLVARHALGCDGIVVAISFDSGVRAARELSGLPTLGLTEASLIAASTMGARIGLVMLRSRARTLYQELIESYGASRKVCGVRALDTDVFYSDIDQRTGDAELIAAARDLVAVDGAEVVVLLGSVLGCRSLQIEQDAPVPVVDGMRCAIPMIEAMVRIGARRPASGSFVAPHGRESVGLSRELEAKLSNANDTSSGARGDKFVTAELLSSGQLAKD